MPNESLHADKQRQAAASRLAPHAWLWQVLFVALAMGVVSPIATAWLIHQQKMSVEAWLPGALSLFLIPYVGSALACGWLILRNWKSSQISTRLGALVLAVLGPFAGIIFSMPFVCSIAKECL